MKSATPTRRKSSSAAFPTDEDDGFGGMWNPNGEPEDFNDPWSSSVAVMSQAWPSQDRSGFTRTDATGFPQTADPFVPPRSATKDSFAPRQQAQTSPNWMTASQRMSDEDWLTDSNPRKASAETWGSVAQGRSEESDDWNMDPLSKSEDAMSEARGAPLLGTEGRPIELVDELSEREADLLVAAAKKKAPEPARPNMTTTTATKTRTKTKGGRKMTMVPGGPLEDDESLPRKGLRRFFAQGSKKKKKKGGVDTSAETPASAHVASTTRRNDQTAKVKPRASVQPEPKQGRVAQVLEVTQDQSTVSGITNPVYSENKKEVVRKQTIQSSRTRNAQDHFDVAAFEADPFRRHDNIMAISSETTESSTFGDPFFPRAGLLSTTDELEDFVNDDPALDHVLEDDVSSTESLRERDLIEEEKKEDEDILPMLESRVDQAHPPTYRPKNAASKAAPPPPPAPPSLRQVATSRRSFPSPPAPETKAPTTKQARSLFQRREGHLSRTPPRNRSPMRTQEQTPTTEKSASPMRSGRSSQRNRSPQQQPPGSRSSKGMVPPVRNHRSPSPVQGDSSAPNRRRAPSFRDRSPLRNSLRSRSPSPIPAKTTAARKTQAVPSTTRTAKATDKVIAQSSSLEGSSVTPGMAARLRERRKRNETRPESQNKNESTQSARGRDPVASTPSQRRGREVPSKAEAIRSGQVVKEAKGERSLTPLRRRQARLAQKITPESRNRKEPDVDNDAVTASDSLVSVGSDISRMRFILRRSKEHRNQPIQYGASVDYVFASYDENDPMQRAGLRLLTASVIPIQCAFRRYLALRETFTRMWAVIVIQALSRRFLTRSSLERQHDSAVAIQTVYRGGRARDQVLLEHCCAVEIQRCVRGFLATLEVYEEIYQITIVQSVVRRRQAIDLATDRMVFIIQLQSLARGFLRRIKVNELHTAATVLQKNWRGSYQRLSFELDLLDIVIAQTTVRRVLAQKTVSQMRWERNDQSATKIQKFWRSRSLRLSYQMDLFDIVIAQSAVRRMIARKHTTEMSDTLHENAATTIQTVWRCRYQRLAYEMDLFDIVISQSAVRRLLAKRSHDGLRNAKQNAAATKIQSLWRCYDFSVIYRQYLAARTIQTVWRGFAGALKYKLDLFSIITIQALWRGRTSRRYFGLLLESREHVAAMLIQAQWRRYCLQTAFRQYKAATKIQAQFRSYDCTMNYLHYLSDVVTVQTALRAWHKRRQIQADEERAAVAVQCVVRKHLTSQYLRKTLAARTLQGFCQSRLRKHQVRMEFLKIRAAVSIQKRWRGFVAYADYMFCIADIVLLQSHARRYLAQKQGEGLRSKQVVDAATQIQSIVRFRNKRKTLAATKIQSHWRAFVAETEFFIEKFENRAATIIQSAWRRFVCFSNFIIALDGTIRIQAAARGHLAYCDYGAKVGASLVLQAAYRSRLLTLSQSNRSAIGYVLSSADSLSQIERSAALQLQRLVRGNQTRGALRYFCMVRKIQAVFRGWRVKRAYTLFMSARTIQSVVRGSGMRHAYRVYIASRRIQAAARGRRIRLAYVLFIAARKIQAVWRGSVVRTAYTYYLAARRIQNNWRWAKARRAYCTMHQRLKEYCAAILMQSIFRRRLARMHFVTLRGHVMADDIRAAIQVQSLWRGLLLRRRGYMFTRWIYIKQQRFQAATTIQRHWRGHSATEKYFETLGSVIQIQAFARRWKDECIYNTVYTAAIVLQSFFRLALAKQELERRRFVRSLVATIHGQDTTPQKPKDELKDWEMVVFQQKKYDRAARVIQRFFVMVKKEVDRAIKAEKKRRKRKKKSQRNRRTKEDDLLDSIWESTVDGSGMRGNPMDGVDMNQASRGDHHSANQSESDTKRRLPAEYATSNRNSTRPAEDDTRSNVSFASSSFQPAPLLRMALPTRVIDEDYALETAWMDAEINVAKESHRRMEASPRSLPRARQN